MRSEAKTRKKLRAVPMWAKAALLIVLLGFIAWQLLRQDWSKLDAFQLREPVWLVFSLLLVAANQGCEWLKWTLVARRLTADRTTIRNAFFSGIGTGFLTPNGWGNFIGRMVFFRRRDRMFIVLSSFLSNVSQVLPTIFFGAVACIFSAKMPPALAAFVFGIGTALLLLFLFGEKLLPRRRSRYRLLRHFRLAEEKLNTLRVPLLFWSAVRFQVFSLQYVFLFMAFGYTEFWFLLTHVWLVFLLTSFVPSLWSGKIVVRETAAIFVFTGSAVAVPDVVLVSLLIWLFNIVLPAVVSSYVWMPVSKRPAHVAD